MPAAHLEGHVPALLFDRLISRDPGDGRLPDPPRQLYDRYDLVASIREQLGWLLNTRVPVDYETLDARTRLGARSTIDYGLPDLTVYPIGDAQAVARLAQHLAQAIALFEPRLQSPAVELFASPERSDLLMARVAGEIRIGLMVEAASFVFEISAEEGSHSGG